MNLEDLSSAQKKAVLEYEGPVLVLAGAGSGKTRVITYRIAFLLQERLARPWEILAVTFTNKAAAEMRERVQALVGSGAGDLYLGTFHAFGARFLRQHGAAFGRDSRFSIYDDDDQSRVIRTLLKAGYNEEQVKSYFGPAKGFIATVKGGLEDPHQAAASLNPAQRKAILELYFQYEAALRSNNAFDFDDLISLPCRLLRDNRELLEQYRRRYRFVLIDEFQDTNVPQGELARLLAAPTGNITAVGDDDQSIYGWRGAVIGNILDFERDYRNVRIFRLEQNYRSTQAILDAAYEVIKNNLGRHPKKLWTQRKGGEKPRVLATGDDREEARTVVARIQEILSTGRYTPGQIVILYRTNAQSRSLEDALRVNTIPYVIVGGLRFYERKEIKDFLAYLRLLVNPNDVLSLQRIINLPPRGIGEKTMGRLSAFAVENGLTLFQAILRAGEIEDLPKRMTERLEDFGKWIEGLRAFAERENLHKVGEKLLQDSGLLEYYQKEESAEFLDRRENISELLNALREYSFESRNTGMQDLENFLQEVALVTDIDRWDRESQAVTLMTLHAAKGLEFPVVFMTGLEDGLFPLQNSTSDPQELEEERRLFYVGATRAKDLLFLTYARHRMRWGQEVSWQRPSRFLQEIPATLLEKEDEPEQRYPVKEENDLFRRSKQRSTLGHSAHKPSLGPESIQRNSQAEYPLGCRVMHSQFGEGVVIRSEGSGEALRLLVNFEGAGQKLLLAKYARLQKII